MSITTADIKEYQPQLTDAGLDAAESVVALDEYGNPQAGYIACERPLTVYIDKREVVTLMTIGTHPELLILGWLRNQRFIQDIAQIRAIQVDWETESAAVTTRKGVEGLTEKLSRKTVTTGCGQGTVFGNLMDDIDKIRLTPLPIRQSTLYSLLRILARHNEVYRRAGAVHGCALCTDNAITLFVEDVGRHNAVDAIAGYMWLNGIEGHNKIFYTTGRLTSEMVIKVSQMGIPLLLSRSGITHMGLELARQVGLTLVARAKGQHFLIYHGADTIELDAIPGAAHAGNSLRNSLHESKD